ncbi:MAG: 4-(cytidine 5'-diphospho)-2-C-methyl-D-erythritol kinase [Thermoguttaceae bacterium]|nr:4-(cytidine 5'-diphospho)-2-C-methyl-D-erythritol kinase [Thermoguttaceae bacterium]
MDRSITELTVRTPAKLNLFFEVLGPRADGYHEVDAVFLPIDLCDTLRAEVLPSVGGTEEFLDLRTFDFSGREISDRFPLRQNLVYRAAYLLSSRSGCRVPTRLTLVKTIPAQAGLGGGSSDAAAALYLLNRLWKCDFSRERLAALGAELGSDVPLFFTPGLSRGRGRGEIIEPLFAVRPLWFVLFQPGIGLSTADVYRALESSAERRIPEALLAALAAGSMEHIIGRLFNRLEEPARRLCPELARVAEAFQAAGAPGARMTGSGTAFYFPCGDLSAARNLADRLNEVLVSRSITGDLFLSSACSSERESFVECRSDTLFEAPFYWRGIDNGNHRSRNTFGDGSE